MLEVRNLSKAYNGVPVLKEVSFSAGPGITCLTGPSGTGKTTLLRILLGLEHPDRGEIRGLEGLRLSAVFQEDRLLEHLSARENLRFVLGRAYDDAAAGRLLARLGLGAVEERPTRSFSGGMKRRLALARALCVPFDLLALDEPFTGLDGENRARAMGLIRAEAEGKTVLLVTHDPGDMQGTDTNLVAL